MNHFRVISVLLLLIASSLSAQQRVVAKGAIEFDSLSSIYYLADSAFDCPNLSFEDPNDLLTEAWDQDQVQLILTSSSGSPPSDLPHLVLIGIIEPGTSPSSSPDLFAGADNGLYPSVDEPLPMSFQTALVSPPDSDGDGTPDSEDAFPDDPTETTDTDGDQIGNNADPDDDGDLIPDTYETTHQLNPLSNDAAADADADGQSNLDEYLYGTAASERTSRFFLRPSLNTPDTLEYPAKSGRTYRIFAGNNPSNLQPVGNPIIVTNDGVRQLTPPPDSFPLFLRLSVTLTNP